jgi:hypothetical protein
VNVRLDFVIINASEEAMRKPNSPFAETSLSEVAGLLKTKVEPKTAQEIAEALRREAGAFETFDADFIKPKKHANQIVEKP